MQLQTALGVVLHKITFQSHGQNDFTGESVANPNKETVQRPPAAKQQQNKKEGRKDENENNKGRKKFTFCREVLLNLKVLCLLSRFLQIAFNVCFLLVSKQTVAQEQCYFGCSIR